MGVTGLWQILDSIGHPVKLDGLEGKRLGVDANIWLYKFIRGFKEKDGAVSIESHKLGLFNRISKLLFYKIKPVFVFDGPAPVLKRKTLEKRHDVRTRVTKVQELGMKVLAEQLKQQYPNLDIQNVKIKLPELMSNNLVAAEKLGEEDKDLFNYSSKPADPESDDSHDSIYEDDLPDKVDIKSKQFEELPPEIRHEILHNIKAEKKRVIVNEVPEDAGAFSKMQMERLRARRLVQEKIEKCERDICASYTGYTNMCYVNRVAPTSSQLNEEIELRPVIQLEKHDFQEKKLIEPRIYDSVATKKPSEDDRNLFNLSPEIVDLSSDESLRDGDKDQVNVSSKTVNLISDDDSDESLISIYGNDSPEEDVRTRVTKELGIEVPAEQLKQQYLDLDIQNVKIQFPELISNNLVAAEKLGRENKDLVNVSSKTVDLISDDSHESIHEDNLPDKVDVQSERSEELPPEIRHENLHNINAEKERFIVNEVPEDAEAFSSMQMRRLGAESPVQIDTEKCERDIRTTELDQTSIPSMSQSDEIVPQSIKEPVKSQSTQEPVTSQSISRDPQLEGPIDRPEQELQLRQPNQPSVNRKIVEEAKELLRLFGIPYIDATGEAEAQCALLEELKLTDGTITDDSDVWLFGAKTVFRHFFSDDKYVMQYKMSDIQFHISMTRENLVCFAMLVGSDYTEGIQNVGPVAALEVLSEFPGDDLEPLIKLKKWKDNYPKEKILVSKNRAKFLKWYLPETFPSRSVFEGYMRPMADASTKEFKWGTPELDELREYARRNFGWNNKKTDDKLLPVMKRLSERSTQSRIDSFFFKTAANRNPELFRSKRVNLALDKISKKKDEVILTDDDEEDEAEVVKPKQQVADRKRKATKSVRKRSTKSRKN